MPIGLRSNTLVRSMRIAADPRTTGNPMPTPRYFAAAAVVGGEILVADGNFETNVLSTLETYNPLTDTWAVRAPNAHGARALGADPDQRQTAGLWQHLSLAYDPTNEIR